jgi:hypothetical protein
LAQKFNGFRNVRAIGQEIAVIMGVDAIEHMMAFQSDAPAAAIDRGCPPG